MYSACSRRETLLPPGDYHDDGFQKRLDWATDRRPIALSSYVPMRWSEFSPPGDVRPSDVAFDPSPDEQIETKAR
jgi:hypothetical protein